MFRLPARRFDFALFGRDVFERDGRNFRRFFGNGKITACLRLDQFASKNQEGKIRENEKYINQENNHCFGNRRITRADSNSYLCHFLQMKHVGGNYVRKN